ncbi:hypothetical protein AB0N61_06785 [Microbacterium sp. NPDC089320]|uniref:hypothetical protein n=1 Tax=Microbacterium sp. NPDC089320 TaxID=3155182 RepID=UPI00342CDF33
MTADPLDEMLDRSAPGRYEPDPSVTHAMIVAARDESRPPTRHRRRTAVLSGLLTLFLVGGTGVAVASSDWLWGPGLDDLDRVYTYTSPTWGECELRFSAMDTHDVFTNARVNRIVDEWFAATNVEAAAAPLVPKYLATLEAADDADASAEADPRRADLNAWTANEQAVGELIHDQLRAHGFGGDVLAGTDAHSQVHCEGEEWGEEE